MNPTHAEIKEPIFKYMDEYNKQSVPAIQRKHLHRKKKCA